MRSSVSAAIRENRADLFARHAAQSGANTSIKAYLRRRDHLPRSRKYRARVLHGDVCRVELLVEFDCTQMVD